MWAMEPILAILLTAIAAVLFTLLLRSAGLTRASIIGGILAGALLGSTLLGRIAPDLHERYFVGGLMQRQTLDHLRSEHGAALKALDATGVSRVAVEELQRKQRAEMDAATQDHDAATAAHQKSRLLLAAIIALALIVAAAPRSRRPASWTECTFAALWMIVVTCGIVGLAVVFAFQGSRMQAIALGLTFAAVGTNVILPLKPGEETTQPAVLLPLGIRDRLTDIAFIIWFACFVALITGVLAAAQSGSAQAADFTPALLIAVVVGVALKLLPLRARHALRIIVLPSILTALLLVNTDLMTPTLIGPLVLAVLVGGDARWFGLASGLRWQGWPWRHAWLGTMPLVDAAPMQVAVAGAFFLTGWLSEPLLACAVFGAAVCDVTQPLRPRLLTMLNEPTEDQSQS